MRMVLTSLVAAALVLLGVGVIAQEIAPVAPGTAAPSLSVAEWIKGEPVKLEDGKGKDIYVVEFWATWCPPCRETIPHLTELQEKYKDKNVVIVGVTDEDAETVKAFVEKMGDKMDYRIALDKDEQTYAAFDKVAPIPGIPFAFVVDKDGTVVWAGLPFLGLDDVLKKLTEAPAANEDMNTA